MANDGGWDGWAWDQTWHCKFWLLGPGTLALGAVAGPGLRPARLLSLRLRLPSVVVEPKRGQGQGRGRGKSSGSNNRGESQNTREYERWKADHARMLAAEEAQRRAETRLQEVEGELWAQENETLSPEP